jgi:hypothetical protein
MAAPLVVLGRIATTSARVATKPCVVPSCPAETKGARPASRGEDPRTRSGARSSDLNRLSSARRSSAVLLKAFAERRGAARSEPCRKIVRDTRGSTSVTRSQALRARRLEENPREPPAGCDLGRRRPGQTREMCAFVATTGAGPGIPEPSAPPAPARSLGERTGGVRQAVGVASERRGVTERRAELPVPTGAPLDAWRPSAFDV